ncbi:MAG: DUF3667 domain-containing protein [Cytophagaceae bacterium]|jgi:hypothetical protein|nr:DUF3667 domain-containing protein [Cytophagaceae bacterium]
MRFKIKLPRKKTHSLPPDNICRNCGTPTVGRYCHECGQDVLAGVEQPIWAMLKNMLDNAFAIDGKVPLTLVNLLFRPGFLSNEYRAGRIVRHMHPVKILWFSLLVFFALVIPQINKSVEINWNNMSDSATEQQAASPESLAVAAKPTAETPPELAAEAKETMQKDREILLNIFDYFSTYGPFIAFLLTPVFGLLLAWFFKCSKLYYMYHLIFAVHFHTFFLALLNLSLIKNILLPNSHAPNWLGTWLEIIYFVITPIVYLCVSVHRFYQTPTKLNAVWKSLLLVLLYSVIFIIITISLLAVVVLIIGVE